MSRCPGCEHPIPEDRERIGARCPACHDPLYEPATRIPRSARIGEAACALHPESESVGACGQCGKDVCETCRTRWVGRICCAACVSQELKAGFTRGPGREHHHLARSALCLGAAGWGIASLTLLLFQLVPAGRAGIVVTFCLLLTLAGAVLVAAVATGQGLAALRLGGTRCTQAIVGMVLGASYVGIALGMAALALWQY